MLNTLHLELICDAAPQALLLNRADDVSSHRLVLSTPFGVLSYLLLWFVPRGPTSPAVGVLWFLTAACLFETLMSVSVTGTSHPFTQWWNLMTLQIYVEVWSHWT